MRTRLVLALLAVTGFATSAGAHAFLQRAMPGAGDNVAAPKAITLSFSEALEPAFSGATVTDAAGNNVAAAAPAISGSSLTIALKSLAAGTYQVSWHVVSIDTHRTEGSYRFTVKP